MPQEPAAPALEETLRRLAARERRGNRRAALRRALAATALALLVVAAWRAADRVLGREPMPLAWALALVGVAACVGVVAVLRAAAGRGEEAIARAIDRRLGLEDRASAALAVLRGGASSRLSGYVVADADAAVRGAQHRVDALFPERSAAGAGFLARWALRGALAAVVLALLAELIGLAPLVRRPGSTPGPGDPSPEAGEEGEAPPEEPGSGPGPAPAGEGGDATRPPEPESRKDPEPADASVQVTLRMTKDEYGPDEPIEAFVAAAPNGAGGGARTFDVRISVDGIEADTGALLRVAPDAKDGESVTIDLRRVPGLRIGPGERTARARLVTRTDREEHGSEEARFRVRGPEEPQGEGPKGEEPKPEPKPQGRESRPEPEEKPPESAPPPPPASTERKVVVPLFGEGELVRKKGPVLVLDPRGGSEGPPKRARVEDALPDARRRAEESVDVARLPDADRELVRRYFELLESLGR
jgi:hypothetical protein